MILPPEFRTCTACGTRQPLDDHHFSQHRRKSGGVTLDCRRCRSAAGKRRLERIYADPERHRQYKAKRNALVRRQRQTPRGQARMAAAQRRYVERHYADVIIRNRMLYRIRLDREGADGRGTAIEPYRPPSCKDNVSAAPFKEFLCAYFPGKSAETIASETRDVVPDRRLWDVLHGHPVVQLPTVDTFLTHGMGRPDLLEVLYPYEPKPAKPIKPKKRRTPPPDADAWMWQL